MLSKTARIALRAVLCIAERQASGPVSARTLARELDLPQNYLSKTLYRLVQDDLLVATRGRGGGYLLTEPAAGIALGRVVEAIDPEGPERRCLLGRPECSPNNPCAMHGRWCEVREAIDRFFSETTLGDLLSPPATAAGGHSRFPSTREPDSMSDPTSAQPPPAPKDDTPVPLMQRLYDSPFLLLAACIVVMFVFFTAWGVLEIMSLDPAPLP